VQNIPQVRRNRASKGWIRNSRWFYTVAIPLLSLHVAVSTLLESGTEAFQEFEEEEEDPNPNPNPNPSTFNFNSAFHFHSLVSVTSALIHFRIFGTFAQNWVTRTPFIRDCHLMPL